MPVMTRVLVACAPLKGTLSAIEAPARVAQGLRQRGHDVEERPLPDGGEGTAAVPGQAWGFSEMAFMVHEVLGQATDAAAVLQLPIGHLVARCAPAPTPSSTTRG